MNKCVLGWGVVTALLLIAGCASQVYNTSSLSQPNRFAIVSVTGMTSGLGLSQAEDTELVTATAGAIYKELRQSDRFKLASPATVKRSHGYRLIQSESTDGIYTLKVAEGYKKFDATKEGDALKKLMAELKLTGVIQVQVVYGKQEKSAWMSGVLPLPVPVSGGLVKGQVSYTITAYNAADEVIWRDTVTAATHDSVISVMGISNVGKLYPELLDVAQEATRTALKDLDEKLAAR